MENSKYPNEILKELNIAYSNSLNDEIVEMNISVLFIYEIVKEYYCFRFNHSDLLYYSFSGTVKFYEKIKTKYSSELYRKVELVVNELKLIYPNKKFLLLEDSRLSYTVKMIENTKESEEVTIFFSISMIGKIYTLLIEQPSNPLNRVYISPEGAGEEQFITINNAIKNQFEDYEVIPFSLLKMDFFGLVVPTLNSFSHSTGEISKAITTMQGLFFDYDVFNEQNAFIGDKRYNSERFLAQINTTVASQMKELLNNADVKMKEM